MQKFLVILSILMLLSVLLLAAPPDVPEKPAEPAAPEVEIAPDAEPEPNEKSEDQKYIEIRIDDDGIRAIDLEGNEITIEGTFGAPEDVRGIEDCEESMTKFGTFYVNEDEELSANLVVFGDVIVEGAVYCDIVSSKTVTLGPTALVVGDITAKKLNVDPNAEFLGAFTEYDLSFPGGDLSIGLPSLPAWISVLVFSLLVAMLVQLVFPRAVGRVRSQIDDGFFKNLLVGFLIFLAIPLVLVLLSITIVGIPVVVFVFPFALVAAIILADIGAAQFAGIFLGRRFESLKYGSSYLTTAAGVVLMMLPWILSGFFVTVGSRGLAIAFFVIGNVFASMLTLAGLGALWFSRFGTRPKDFDDSPEVAPKAETSIQTN